MNQRFQGEMACWMGNWHIESSPWKKTGFVFIIGVHIFSLKHVLDVPLSRRAKSCRAVLSNYKMLNDPMLPFHRRETWQTTGWSRGNYEQSLGDKEHQTWGAGTSTLKGCPCCHRWSSYVPWLALRGDPRLGGASHGKNSRFALQCGVPSYWGDKCWYVCVPRIFKCRPARRVWLGFVL